MQEGRTQAEQDGRAELKRLIELERSEANGFAEQSDADEGSTQSKSS